MYTVTEFAEFLGIARSTAYAIVRRNEIDVVEIAGGTIRISEDSIKAYVEARTRRAKKDP